MTPEQVVLFSPDARLGMAIRAARLRHQRTLQEVARELYLDPRTLDRIELGQLKTVRLSTVQAISRVLKSPLILRMGIEQIQRAFPQDMPPSEEVAV